MPNIPTTRERGFSLVELLVSIAILSIILILLGSMVGVVQKTWNNTSGKISQFQSARDAFQAITNRLSLATLNTYWGYDNVVTPANYIRISELRYINGPAGTLLKGFTGNAKVSSQAIFFIAPENYQDNTTYSSLQGLLNTWGYFIQFDNDSQNRPGFLASLANNPAPRYRFRLMEMAGAPEYLNVYKYTSGVDTHGNLVSLSYFGANGYSYNNNSNGMNGLEWFTELLNQTPPPTRVLAENIVALIILPKLSKQEEESPTTPTILCPNYSYDSSMPYADGQGTGTQTGQTNTLNQLPPTVQVTMVAVDEASYARYQTSFGTTQPTLVSSSLFKQSVNYTADLQTLQNTLQADHLNYRVFTSEVTIKGAKWSQSQTGTYTAQ